MNSKLYHNGLLCWVYNDDAFLGANRYCLDQRCDVVGIFGYVEGL